jgi:hypothetical protein
MLRVIRFVVGSIYVAVALFAETPRGSSVRGERLFETQQCIRCHSVKGLGGSSAPDLGRRIGRNQSGSVASVKTRAWRGGRCSSDHAVVSPNSRPTKLACPAMSFFGNHLTCPFRIMFIVSMP